MAELQAQVAAQATQLSVAETMAAQSAIAAVSPRVEQRPMPELTMSEAVTLVSIAPSSSAATRRRQQLGRSDGGKVNVVSIPPDFESEPTIAASFPDTTATLQAELARLTQDNAALQEQLRSAVLAQSSVDGSSSSSSRAAAALPQG